MNNEEHSTEIGLAQLWGAAEILVSKGWHPVPIEPRSKACKIFGWTRFCTEAPTVEDLTAWAGRDPLPGIGLALGRRLDDGSHLIALDGDVDCGNDEFMALMDRLEARLGLGSAPAKVGRRGRTVLLRLSGFDGSTTKARHRERGDEAGDNWHFDILATGAQTVIPPSEHPGTGAPYYWLGGRSLWPKGDDGRPTIRTVESLPTVALSDLVAALDAEGFNVSSLRRRRLDTLKPEAVQVAAGDLDRDEAALAELLDDLEYRADDLGDVWRRGGGAAVFGRRGIDNSGSGRRHEFAFQCRKAGLAFGDYVALLREWPHATGNKSFSIDDDLARPGSRLVDSWTTAGRRLEAAHTEDDATGAFAAAVEGEAEPGPGGDAGRFDFRRATALPLVQGVEAFRLTHADGANLTYWNGLIGKGRRVMIWGPAHAGKSTIAHAIVEGLCRGVEVAGRATEKVGCAWMPWEDAAGTRNRYLHGVELTGETYPFVMIDAAGLGLPNLMAPDLDIKRLARLIVRALASAGEAAGVLFTVLVLDALQEAMQGAGSVNSNDDLARAVRLIRELEQHGIVCIMLHHAGKDVSRGALGGQFNYAFFDLMLEVGEGKIVINKNRGGSVPAGASWTYDLVDTASALVDAAGRDGGEFTGLPRVEFGPLTVPGKTGAVQGRAGRPKLARPTPGSVGDEVLRLIETRGPMGLPKITEAVIETRAAMGADTPTCEKERKRLRDAIRRALLTGETKGWVTPRDGVWWASSDNLGMALAEAAASSDD